MRALLWSLSLSGVFDMQTWLLSGLSSLFHAVSHVIKIRALNMQELTMPHSCLSPGLGSGLSHAQTPAVHDATAVYKAPRLLAGGFSFNLGAASSPAPAGGLFSTPALAASSASTGGLFASPFGGNPSPGITTRSVTRKTANKKRS